MFISECCSLLSEIALTIVKCTISQVDAALHRILFGDKSKLVSEAKWQWYSNLVSENDDGIRLLVPLRIESGDNKASLLGITNRFYDERQISTLQESTNPLIGVRLRPPSIQGILCICSKTASLASHYDTDWYGGMIPLEGSDTLRTGSTTAYDGYARPIRHVALSASGKYSLLKGIYEFPNANPHLPSEKTRISFANLSAESIKWDQTCLYWVSADPSGDTAV
jgi:hypothetical protein